MSGVLGAGIVWLKRKRAEQDLPRRPRGSQAFGE